MQRKTDNRNRYSYPTELFGNSGGYIGPTRLRLKADFHASVYPILRELFWKFFVQAYQRDVVQHKKDHQSSRSIDPWLIMETSSMVKGYVNFFVGCENAYSRFKVAQEGDCDLKGESLHTSYSRKYVTFPPLVVQNYFSVFNFVKPTLFDSSHYY